VRNRFRNLVGYALNCINRYKVRTAVILICLGVSASLFASVSFMKDGLVREGALSLKYAPDITVQGISAGRQTLIDTRSISYIQEAPDVSRVEARIWGYANIGNTLLVIKGVDLENIEAEPTQGFSLEAGSFLTAQSTDSVVIGKAVGDLLGAKVGSVLTILTESVQSRQYVVVGIFNSESGIYSADMVLMTFNDARSFFDVPEDKVTDFAVYVNDPKNVNNVARDISELQNVRVLTKDILLKAQETTYGARSGFFSVVWYILLISVAVIAINQSVVVGHESKFEVGLLKALGFSTWDIIQVRLIESTMLGALAGSLGITFGVFYDTVLNAPVFRDFMLGWATLYPSFTVPVYVSAQTIFLTYAITVVPLLFATVIPSWLNATIDPDIAMRGAKA
jgi:putative ABC transport system permease protein